MVDFVIKIEDARKLAGIRAARLAFNSDSAEEARSYEASANKEACAVQEFANDVEYVDFLVNQAAAFFARKYLRPQ
jgi:hypothetical protein